MSVVANVAINVDAANAIQQLNRVKTASKDVQGGFTQAAAGARGLGAALTAALGPMLSVAAALSTIQKSLNVAFERGTAEQRLRNLTSSTEEFNAAMAVASQSASKFGITQTDAATALADVYGRLKGVGFGLQETGQIYQGFNAIALQSGLAGEEAAGAFFQLSQALGKGKLNGDEFVIVAERMPQLLDAIASTTGRSRGELTQMAQDGKITSQVLYEALSGAAEASDNLNGKLTAQQQTFNNLRQVADQLLNSIGQVFSPVIITGAEALAKTGQMLADWYGYVAGEIFPKVQQALQPIISSMKAAFEDIDFSIIRVVVQNVLIKGFEIALGVINNVAKALGFVVDRFKELSRTPVFKLFTAAAGKLVDVLGLANDKVAEFKKEQTKASEAVASTVKNFSSLPPVIEETVSKTKKLKEEQNKGVDATAKTVVQAKDLSSQVDKAAQGAAAYANNMQAGAVATQKAAIAATPKEPGTLAGLTPYSFMRNFQTTRNGMPFGAVSLRARAAGELGTMKDAMQTYSPTTQANTAQVNPQINVTTGPVMQMDGTNYVTQRDFTAGMQTAARQGAGMALNSLRSNPSTRRSVGLAR